jgi:hypothetical protein
MRKMLVAGVLSTVAVVGTAVPAAAQPPGQEKNAEEFVCSNGEPTTTTIIPAGRNGWIDGVKYHAVEFLIVGTFTPVGGEPVAVSDSKTWAGGKDVDSPDLITCTSTILEDDETGTFEGTFTVTAVPAG